MVRKSLKILAVLVVVIVAAYFLLPVFQLPFAAADVRELRTSIFVGTPEGEVRHFQEGSNLLGLPQNSIVQVGGIQITYVRWVTTYTASSPEYNQYTVISASMVKVELFALLPDPFLPPDNEPLCAIMTNVQINPAGNFDIGVVYSVGGAFMGMVLPDDETVKVTDVAVAAAADAGCGGVTVVNHILRYTISISVQAVGVAPVPSDTAQEIVSTDITISAGSITGVTSTTVESG